MSESSTGEKTEDPTPKRLRDARKKGQVSNSKDFNSTAILFACFYFISIFWVSMFKHLMEMITLPTLFYTMPFKEAMGNVIMGTAVKFMWMSFPILGVVVVTALLTNIIQVGFLVSWEPLKPELKKLNPAEGAKKIFSKKNAFEFLKSTFKVLLLGVILFYVIRSLIGSLFKIPPTGIEGVMAMLPQLLKIFSIYVILAYVLVAVADYLFQKRQHWNELKMTKDELKREYKESEGDPQIKGKRKQIHREIMMQEAVQNTKKSSVVVTNPTHYAIALYYDYENEEELPKVVAKGMGVLAHKIMEIADKERIPRIQNVPLAHDLYNKVELEEAIPAELIKPVAEVLRWAKEYMQEKALQEHLENE